MNINQASRIVGAFLLSGVVAFPQQPGDQILSKHVHSFSATANAISDLLSPLANKYQIPIGVEVISETSTTGGSARMRVSVEDGTVKDVLNAVVAAQPGYSWREVDGVIDVMPSQHVDSVLDVIISKFEVKQLYKNEALAKLTGQPEVRAWMARTGVKDRTFFGGSVSASTDSSTGNITLNLLNASVRTILNQMMKASNSYSWVYFRYGPENRYFSLSM